MISLAQIIVIATTLLHFISPTLPTPCFTYCQLCLVSKCLPLLSFAT